MYAECYQNWETTCMFGLNWENWKYFYSYNNKLFILYRFNGIFYHQNLVILQIILLNFYFYEFYHLII